ncbi:MAG: hypothetical protein KGI60_00915 [Patescibacteria group bacterium]|nr:hypothetical protein [Patescibacteria group bacterium]
MSTALRFSIAASAAILIAAFSLTIFARAHAASNAATISYPIAELGSCASAADCKTYCDDPSHASACLTFAQAHGLVSSADAQRVQAMQDVTNGPGGCNSLASCQTYCNDITHINECVSYAEQHNLMSASQLDQAKKVQQAVQNNVKFPGGCTTKDQCQTYCNDPSHASECLAFAQSTGIVSSDQAQQAAKIMPYIRSGQAPGGCASPEACQAYCSDQSHVDECAAFAQKAGLATPDQIAAFKKTGGVGPGGCVGSACQAYCQQPENQQTCFEFAQQNGLISPQQIQQMQQGQQRMKQALENSTGDLKTCLTAAVGGADAVQQIETGSSPFFGGPEVGNKVGACMQQYPPTPPPPPQGFASGTPSQMPPPPPNGQFNPNQNPGNGPQGQFPPQGFASGTPPQMPPPSGQFNMNQNLNQPPSGQNQGNVQQGMFPLGAPQGNQQGFGTFQQPGQQNQFFGGFQNGGPMGGNISAPPQPNAQNNQNPPPQGQQGFSAPGNPPQGMNATGKPYPQNGAPMPQQNGTMMPPPPNMQSGQFNPAQIPNQPPQGQGQFPPTGQNGAPQGMLPGIQPKFPDMQSQFQNQLQQNPVDALRQIGQPNQPDNGTGTPPPPPPPPYQNQASGAQGMPPPGGPQGGQQGSGAFPPPMPPQNGTMMVPPQNMQNGAPPPPQTGTVMPPPSGSATSPPPPPSSPAPAPAPSPAPTN